jgi:hypothetical protein
MNPQDQEKLFLSLRAIHPQWGVRFCSGYVHGVRDEEKRRTPQVAYIQGAVQKELYSTGYLTGFAVRRGSDAEVEPWFDFVGDLVSEA